MSKTAWIIIGIAVAIIIGMIAGFFIGRAVYDNEDKYEVQRIITRVPGEKVTQYIDKPVPVAVHDTIIDVRVVTPDPTDTAALFAVWRDYYLTRDYELDFSNDTIGEFRVCTSVAENKLLSAESTIRPLRTTITETKQVTKVKTLQGFILLGSDIKFQTNQISAGVDIKQRVLVGASALRFNDSWSYTINVGVKF